MSVKSIADLDCVQGIYPATQIDLGITETPYPHTVTFGVDQEHIVGAVPEDDRCTALARCIRDRYGGANWIVTAGDRYIELLACGAKEGQPDQYWMMDPDCYQWCKDEFDGKPVKPTALTLIVLERKEYLYVVHWVQQTVPSGDDDLYGKIPEQHRITRFTFDAYWNICDQTALISYDPHHNWYTPSQDGFKAFRGER